MSRASPHPRLQAHTTLLTLILIQCGTSLASPTSHSPTLSRRQDNGTTTVNESTDDGGSNNNIIYAGILGGIAVVLILLSLIICYNRRKRARRVAAQAPTIPANEVGEDGRPQLPTYRECPENDDRILERGPVREGEMVHGSMCMDHETMEDMAKSKKRRSMSWRIWGRSEATGSAVPMAETGTNPQGSTPSHAPPPFPSSPAPTPTPPLAS